MSSGTSTDIPAEENDGLQPWQLFVLAAIGCATALTFIVRGQGVVKIALSTILMASAALVGLAALRLLRPLVGAYEDRTLMIGEKTRVALEREKMLVLKSIKELEFDKAMGKVSEADWQDMGGRLRARAARLMRQLDAGTGYRDQIESALAKRLGSAPDSRATEESSAHPSSRAEPTQTCAACSASNDSDAKFCKSCGRKL